MTKQEMFDIIQSVNTTNNNIDYINGMQDTKRCLINLFGLEELQKKKLRDSFIARVLNINKGNADEKELIKEAEEKFNKSYPLDINNNLD